MSSHGRPPISSSRRSSYHSYSSSDDIEAPPYPEASEYPTTDANEQDLYQPFSPEVEKAARRLTIKHAKASGIDYDTTGQLPRSNVDTLGKIEISLDIDKPLPAPPYEFDAAGSSEIDLTIARSDCPPLNIVIFVVGSRGDVQPYIALALGLIRSKGHRVRLATHGEFEAFVLEANQHLEGEVDSAGRPLAGRLEFFNAGGDPRELMAYMVKNPGLMPGIESLINGDIKSKRKMTATYLKGFYNSTFFPDRRNGHFAADAIISNPPAFAHIHVAQAMGIPLHMSFTMPWTPTTQFQHPLVTIKESNAEPGIANLVSFTMADVMIWQGLGDLINKLRSSMLGLHRLPLRDGPGLINRSFIPWTYCWSQSLIPKPKDWKKQVDIAGFYFLPASTKFKPDADLVEFLAAGPAPIYIGFGSVPVKDPAAMTKTIFDAVKLSGVRALISAGWGGLGGIEPSSDVFILKGSIPHDWLFADGRVCAVCHHGGAGTTAIGLQNGLPTIVVPFFGDQQFWGDMIANAGAGPKPIPSKSLDAVRLAEAIEFALSDDARAAAGEMGRIIRAEDGVKSGVESFHRHLPIDNMRCQVDPSRVALWWSNEYHLRLSGAAAALLHQSGKLDFDQLKLHRSKEYDFAKRHSDPATNVARGIAHVATTGFQGVAQLFVSPGQGLLDLTWGIHHAAFGVVYDLWEGMDNLPALMGSDTRERGKVTNFSSGMKEGAICLGYGVWDAFAGLVTEPIVGGKRDGVKGAMLGSGKSVLNFLTRPAAGFVGFVVLPFQGATASIKTKLRRTPEAVYQTPRRHISFAQAERLTTQERISTMESWNAVSQTKAVKRRKREVAKRRHRVFLTGENIPPRQPPRLPSRSTSTPDRTLRESSPR